MAGSPPWSGQATWRRIAGPRLRGPAPPALSFPSAIHLHCCSRSAPPLHPLGHPPLRSLLLSPCVTILPSVPCSPALCPLPPAPFPPIPDPFVDSCSPCGNVTPAESGGGMQEKIMRDQSDGIAEQHGEGWVARAALVNDALMQSGGARARLQATAVPARGQQSSAPPPHTEASGRAYACWRGFMPGISGGSTSFFSPPPRPAPLPSQIRDTSMPWRFERGRGGEGRGEKGSARAWGEWSSTTGAQRGASVWATGAQNAKRMNRARSPRCRHPSKRPQAVHRMLQQTNQASTKNRGPPAASQPA